MAYQKTAKDLAWDRERTRLQSEVQNWIRRCSEKETTIQEQTKKILTQANRIHELEEVIAKLTNGKMTPDEAIVDLRSSAKIGEMASFIMGWERGGYF